MADVGKVYLVGAGPGDPELLTLKGRRLLAIADVVLYDGLVNPLLLRHTPAHAERTCRVGSGKNRHLDQAEINQRLIDAAQSGKTVVRLKGGDPFVFGRGSEEALALAQAGIPYEVVPGITAAIAAAEYSGISLTHRQSASSVAFITGHEDPTKPEQALDYQILAAFPGTLVFYMGLHRLAQIAAQLMQHGKPASIPVAVISKGTWPQQRVVSGGLQDIAEKVRAAELHAPSLIVVGDCVLQREKIDWFSALPLAGVSIGITRPSDNLDATIDRALALGAEPILMPMIDVAPLEDSTALDQFLGRLHEIDWLIFTSVNGVDAFLNRLWETGGDNRKLSAARIAAIGPGTAKRLEDWHLRADLVPEVYRSEELAKALKPHVDGKCVAWLRASRARDVIPTELAAAGAAVEQVIVYQHRDVEVLPDAALDRMATGTLNWIALSSPAIARNVARLLTDKNSAGTRFAAISPVTAEAAESSGLNISAVAEPHTWDGLFEAIRQCEFG